MGIFSRKPNVQKMIERTDIVGLTKALLHTDRTVRLEVVEALGRVADAQSVAPLTQALKDGDCAVRGKAVEALGRIADAQGVTPLTQALNDEDCAVRGKAVNSLAQIGGPGAVVALYQALQDKDRHVCELAATHLGELGFEPEYGIAIVRYLIDRNCWHLVTRLGESAVEPLIERLAVKCSDLEGVRAFSINYRDRDSIIKFKYRGIDSIIKTLGKIGNKKAAAPVIDNLFEYPRESTSLPSSSFRKLFGDYTDLIINASTYSHSEFVHFDYTRSYSYSSRESKQAIKHLCRIVSPISNNILYKVMAKRSLVVGSSTSHGGSIGPPLFLERRLSFTNLRKMAEAEIARRGNPPYDPSVYLNEKAWKL